MIFSDPKRTPSAPAPEATRVLPPPPQALVAWSSMNHLLNHLPPWPYILILLYNMI